MTFTKSILATSLALVCLSLTAAAASNPSAPTSSKVIGQTGAIISESEFCLFLPPEYGGGIAENEDRAVAFCTNPISTAPKAGTLPKGFVQSAHLTRNTQKGWVQITGRIDRTKYGLNKNDGGGQYDIKAPRGAKCAGYDHFVELVEPDIQTYCIRCCKEKVDCPTHRSTYGCKKVLGGDYS
ncbi:hypothetical protein BGZ51_009132 [Haplosporangium sp. Z 767]|nr:hypothetical protein BGZ51_009132 [Haplosporangium sp. Z 767]KAF9192892.1 hypothetical protein BGZ50_008133 [Haplosporangium sp. Z 11]